MAATHRQDRLRERLRQLPPERASEGFEKRVLAAFDARRVPTHRNRLGTWILATLCISALAFTSGWSLQQRAADRQELLARSQRLRQSHEELAREVEALRRSALEGQPLLYLARDEELDVVLDYYSLVAQSAAEYRAAGSSESSTRQTGNDVRGASYERP